MEHLIVLVEEASMEATLHALLPKLLASSSFELITFQCKDDLLKQAPQRLRAYAQWLPPTAKLLVLVDRDQEDCRALKQRLEDLARAAGFHTKSAPGPQGEHQVVNRIVIEELEAWFFGDWEAMRSAYPRLPAAVPNMAPYRDPDGVQGGTWEALERLLKKAGYFKSGLRKLELARTVAPHLDPKRNRSPSFQCFIQALQ